MHPVARHGHPVCLTLSTPSRVCFQRRRPLINKAEVPRVVRNSSACLVRVRLGSVSQLPILYLVISAGRGTRRSAQSTTSEARPACTTCSAQSFLACPFLACPSVWRTWRSNHLCGQSAACHPQPFLSFHLASVRGIVPTFIRGCCCVHLISSSRSHRFNSGLLTRCSCPVDCAWV
jgi:hypothetical protein